MKRTLKFGAYVLENLSITRGESLQKYPGEREREKKHRKEKREGIGSNMFLVLCLFCRRYSSLKHTQNGAARKAFE